MSVMSRVAGCPVHWAAHAESGGTTQAPRRLGLALTVIAAAQLMVVLDLEKRRARHRRRPLGLRELAGMGDLLPAAPAQLHLHPPDPLRAARLRPALPPYLIGPAACPGHSPLRAPARRLTLSDVPPRPIGPPSPPATPRRSWLALPPATRHREGASLTRRKRNGVRAPGEHSGRHECLQPFGEFVRRLHR